MATAATGGDIYTPMDQRKGDESVVYFSRDISPEGLQKMYEKVNEDICGKVAVKLHTGEPHGPNIIPSSWIKQLLANDLPDATIVETNTLYEGGRYTTEQHRETLKVNGWDFAPVDIMDEHGTTNLPVKGGKWFFAMSVGESMANYDSLVVLTHFKGHSQGGFGGSNKNIGIGCADGRFGKAMIHTYPDKEQWGTGTEEIMEKITESTKATIDFFGKNTCYVNVMRNMSVDCDCAGVNAAPVVTPNVGILASRDICAIDCACVDLVQAMPEEYKHELVERMTSRHGFRQLSYMHELGMGNCRYKLLDTDNGDVEISQADAVAHVTPFEG